MIQKIKFHISNNLALFGITIAGILLRLWHLTAISLWHDEAFSALLIKYSWSEMMTRIGLDVHPPMYYIFLRLWSYVFGSSLYSLRGMSVLFGVATIIVTYFFVNYVFNNHKAALIAAALIAVSPFQVQYVTEARMYTMGAFFAVAAAFALSAALRTQTLYYATVANEVLRAQLKKQFVKYYALFVLCSAILIYTHYYLLFMVAALGAYAVLYCIIHFKTQFTRYGWTVLSGVLILLSFVPWLKTFLFQFRQVGAGYWIPPMDRWSIPDTLWELLLRLPNPAHWMFALIALFTIALIVKTIWKQTETEKWLIIAGFLAPFAGAMLFALLAKLQGESSSVYLVRYFIFCSSFYLIIVALWLSNFKVRQIGMLFTAILLIANIYSAWNYWDELQVQTKPGMAKAAAFLAANVEPDQKVFIGSSFEFFNYKYYNRTPVKPLLFTDGHLTHDLPHYAGTAILTDQDLVLNFTDATKTGDTVWLLWTNGFGGTKPNTPTNWTQVDEKGFAEVRPYVGTWIIVSEYKVN
ncbi:MAG TPA: glycosyltransferase family 39 protein [Patescibacteria group bacterium]|jgi:uncharacterized membrane protein|nr:glycosyltransferase family 39 protein [Patescibacteria group bacterium]